MSEKKGFLKVLSEMLKTVEGFSKPKDRLTSLSQILQSRNATVVSCNNWMYWLGNPVYLDTLTDEQIERIRVFWNELAVKMLHFDIDITSEVQVDEKKEVKQGKIGIEPS